MAINALHRQGPTVASMPASLTSHSQQPLWRAGHHKLGTIILRHTWPIESSRNPQPSESVKHRSHRSACSTVGPQKGRTPSCTPRTGNGHQRQPQQWPGMRRQNMPRGGPGRISGRPAQQSSDQQVSGLDITPRSHPRRCVRGSTPPDLCITSQCRALPSPRTSTNCRSCSPPLHEFIGISSHA